MLSVNSKVGFVRAFLAHGLRAAVRAGGDDGGRARPPRLAGLENLRADSRRDGLRAHLRDGVQSHRGPQIRRAQSAHGKPPSARGADLAGERNCALRLFGGGSGCRQLFSQFTVLLPLARRAGGDLFLFADETIHGLHARLSWARAGAGAGRRVAGGERRKRFRAGKFCK